MPLNLTITQSQVLAALRAFLQQILSSDTQVVQSQQNRVSMPPAPFVTITPMFRTRMMTNVDSWTAAPDQSTLSVATSTRFDVQIDCYGATASDNAQIIATLFRDQFGVSALPLGDLDIAPLYTSDPMQSQFQSGEQQYEDRWTLTASLQINPVLTVTQDFARAASVKLISVDTAYGAQPGVSVISVPSFIFTGFGNQAQLISSLLPAAVADLTCNGLTIIVSQSDMMNGLFNSAATYANFDALCLTLLQRPDWLFRIGVSNFNPDLTRPYSFITNSIARFSSAPQPMTTANPFDPVKGAAVISDFISAHSIALQRALANGVSLSQFHGFTVSGLITKAMDTEQRIPLYNAAPYDANNAAILASWVAGGYSYSAYTSIMQSITTRISAISTGTNLSIVFSDQAISQTGAADPSGIEATAMTLACVSGATNGCKLYQTYESKIPGRPTPPVTLQVAGLTGGMPLQAKDGYTVMTTDAALEPLLVPWIENHPDIYQPGYVSGTYIVNG